MSKRQSTAELLDSMPPAAPESEKAVIAGILVLGSIPPNIDLQPHHFREIRHQVLYRHLVQLDGDQGTIDAALMISNLRQSSELEDIGGTAYIYEIMNQGSSALASPAHAEKIKEAFGRRMIRAEAEYLLGASMNGGIDPSNLRTRFERLVNIVSGEPINAIEYPALTCAKLMTEQFVVRFLVQRIMVQCQPMIVAGPKKALKTSLLVALALALATGSPFLGVFAVYAAIAVGIMTGESGLATIQETIGRIARAMGVDPTLIADLIITDKVPQLGDPRHLLAIKAFIIAHKLRVLIIDPAYMTMSGVDAGNLFIQGQLLRGISEVCQETGCTLILCHHTKKGVANPYAQPELEDIAWAGFQEFARQWILIGRREGYQPGSGLHRLWMTVGGSVGHGGLWGLDIAEGTYHSDGGRFWQINVLEPSEVKEVEGNQQEAAKEAKRQEKRDTDRRKVVNAMAKFPHGETGKVIRSRAGISGERFNVVMSSLLEDGAVVETAVAKANRAKPYDGYKLAEG